MFQDRKRKVTGVVRNQFGFTVPRVKTVRYHYVYTQN